MSVPGRQLNRAAWQACLLALGWVTLGFALPVQAAESRGRADLASFRLITERNIFNASRAPGRAESSRETRRTPRADAFGLVGVMSYDKGTFAFFDGSGSDYRKALQQGGAIAGFQLLEILPNAVKLQAGTNGAPVQMQLGMQMRREEEGEWKLGERTESFPSSGSSSRFSSGASGRSDRSPRSPSPSVSSSGSSPADDGEALQRLLRKREEESQ